jgi:hypothetical protein
MVAATAKFSDEGRVMRAAAVVEATVVAAAVLAPGLLGGRALR